MVLAKSAVLLGNKNTHQPEFSHFPKYMGRELLGFIPLHHKWLDVLLRKILCDCCYLVRNLRSVELHIPCLPF